MLQAHDRQFAMFDLELGCRRWGKGRVAKNNASHT